MSIPTQFLTTTCDIYRPFGAGAPTATNVPCRLTPVVSLEGYIEWSHRLDVQPGVDVRDGCTRTGGTASLNYADGDEVRVPSGGSTRFVVVRVEVVNRGTPRQFQRVYLLRDTASWPDP